MADYSINAVTRRVDFTGSAGLGPYAFTFEILVETDIAVYFNTTLLTLTTDYTVTINANGTGSITIVTGSSVPSTPTGSDTIVIVGARDIERTTDFVTAGDLKAASLNEQLDSLVIFDQQLSERIDRAFTLNIADTSGASLEIPSPTANQVLGWNSTGDALINIQEIGVYRGTDTTTTTAAYVERDLVKSTSAGELNNVYICIQDSPLGTALTNTSYWSLIVDAVSAATSAAAAAASAAAASTSETNAATSESNAATSEANAAASYDAFDDRYLGSKSSDPALDNDGDALVAGALYFNTSTNDMKVYNGSAWQVSYVAPADYVDQDSDTGAANLPTGTTAQRPGTPAIGMFRFNSTNTAFEGYDGSSWGSVGGASGGGGNPFVYENDINVTADYTITSGKNGMSAGPITVDSGVTVTVPTGSVWTIV